MLVNVQDIVIKSGRRGLDNGKVGELADSIVEVGLINPITVSKNMTLIAGRHRLEAYKKLGRDRIEANVIDTTDLKTELIEIDENLIRSELHFTESGDLMARRKAIYEELHPETKKGATPGNQYIGKSRNPSSSKSFVTDTAAKTGKSETVIKEELQIASKVIPEVKEVIRESNIPKSEAIKIARLKPNEQMEAAKLLAEPTGTRVCRTCNIDKPLDQFGCTKYECKRCASFRKRVGGEVVKETKNINSADVMAIIKDMAKKEPSEEGRRNDLDNHILSDFEEFIKSALAKMNFYLVNPAAFNGIKTSDSAYKNSRELIATIEKVIESVKEIN